MWLKSEPFHHKGSTFMEMVTAFSILWELLPHNGTILSMTLGAAVD